ncbi:MAG: ROK family transcriptional regulator [Kineosporiaceae bacterium]
MAKLNPPTAAGQRSESPGPAVAGNAGQASLREANLRLLTALVHASDDPPSRADLATASGLTRSTVSRLVDELLAGGLLRELDRAPTTGRGRPAVPLAPARATLVATGAEVAPAHVSVRCVDLSGQVLAEHRREADLVGSDPGAVLAELGRTLAAVHTRLPDGVRHLGTALALPGLVERGTGRLLQAPNLGWRDVVPAPLVIGADVVHVGNEADLAALALTQRRPGRPSDLVDGVYVSGEVGIGAAVVRAGKVMAGRHGWAGEVGHVSVDPTGPTCRCGSTGCLEQYAGRTAILRSAGLPETTSPTDLARLADDGHVGVRGALARAGWALGVVLAGVVNLLDLPTVVLGGDLDLLSRYLKPAAEPELARRVLSARWVPPQLLGAAEIVSATRDSAGSPAATGAAYRLLAEVLDHPSHHL